jgi:Kef-type K+ transport system membrane component KefB
VDLIQATAVLLLAGYLAGKLAAKLGFPRITGYLLAGVCLNPSLTPVVKPQTLASLNMITPVVLGMISYMIGGGLRLEALQRLRRGIAGIALFQGAAPFALSFALILLAGPWLGIVPEASLLDTYLPMALVLGAISMSSAPAAIVAIVHECRARGAVTTTCFAVLALTDMATVIAFALALGFAQPLASGSGALSPFRMVVSPLLHILLSLGIGATVGWLLIPAVIPLSPARGLPLLLVTAAAILACTFVAEALGLSLILANMVAGFVTVNRTNDEATLSVLERIEELPFLLFFAFNGMSFDFQALEAAGALTVLIVAGRKIGKYCGARFGAWLVDAPEEIRKYPGLVLLPKAGLTLGLAFTAREALPAFGALLFNALILSTLINMLVTPPLARQALIRAGENRA